MSNEWTKPEHAEAYLARLKDIPHRAEGESTLLSEVPVQAKRVLDLGCGNGHGQPTRTCLTIGPDDADQIDAITGHLQLL